MSRPARSSHEPEGSEQQPESRAVDQPLVSIPPKEADRGRSPEARPEPPLEASRAPGAGEGTAVSAAGVQPDDTRPPPPTDDSQPPLPPPPPPLPQLHSAVDGGWLEPVEVDGEEGLRELLSEASIDMTAWNAAGARLPRLYAELCARESSLSRHAPSKGEASGELRRVVREIEVEVRVLGRVLVLTHEEVDGYARRRYELPRATRRRR